MPAAHRPIASGATRWRPWATRGSRWPRRAANERRECCPAGVVRRGARFPRLGALCDLLPQPILPGFLDGIALSIALGQIGKVFGFPIEAGGIIPRLVEFVGKLGLTHGPTLAVGLASFALLLASPRLVPRVPAALVVMAVAAVAVRLLGLEAEIGRAHV